MKGYITQGTNDIDRAAAFYDAVLAEIGARRYMESEGFVAWVVSPKLLSKPPMAKPRQWAMAA